jgi:hypothetical protein
MATTESNSRSRQGKPMTDEPRPRGATPAIGDVLDALVELAGRVEVLTDQLWDLERIVWRLEREDRNRRREHR